MLICLKGLRFTEYKYQSEEEFERDVVASYKDFFTTNAIYVDAKKKIGARSLGNTIPDGFLFDMSDPENREFYLVEMELKRHDFYNHIFPQITKFFAFFRDSKRQKELVEKLFSTINTDPRLKGEFRQYLGKQEIFKFLTDVVDSSQNILLVIDGEKPELPEIMETYSDTWGKMVKLLTVRKYANASECVFAVDPEFEAVEFSYPEPPDTGGSTSVTYSEEFHLEGVRDNVRGIYEALVSRIGEIDSTFVFNPQKYYISIRGAKNIAFLIVRKKRIRLVILLPEEELRASIIHHSIRSLSEPVQNFYNAPCAAVDIDRSENMDEIVEVLRGLMEMNRPEGAVDKPSDAVQ